MQGLEFVVSYDPIQAAAQPDGRFAHEPSNIWVIRKQNRRKRTGLEDEVVVLSTYFIVGDCIYMAPSVASVVGNRIVRQFFPVTLLPRHFLVLMLTPISCAAVRSYVSHQLAKDSIYTTYLHPVPRPYLHAACAQTSRCKSTWHAVAAEQGEHPITGRRCSWQGLARWLFTGCRHWFEPARHTNTRRVIQPAPKVWGGVYGRASVGGRAGIVHPIPCQ